MNLEEIFKSLVWDTVVKLAVTRLLAAVPILAWGPLGVVVGWIAGLLADQLYDALKLVVNLEIIVLKNEAARREYAKAAMDLRLIAEGQGIDSEAFKAARLEHQKRLAEFVKWGDA